MIFFDKHRTLASESPTHSAWYDLKQLPSHTVKVSVLQPSGKQHFGHSIPLWRWRLYSMQTMAVPVCGVQVNNFADLRRYLQMMD